MPSITWPRRWEWVMPALALCAAGGAHAACDPKFQMSFSDGSSGCLPEFAIGKVPPAGYSLPLAEAVQHGYFFVAAPREPRQCPKALGFIATIRAAPQAVGGPLGQARDAESRGRCQRAAGAAVPGGPCECIVVLADGVVMVPRPEFERISQELEAAK